MFPTSIIQSIGAQNRHYTVRVFKGGDIAPIVVRIWGVGADRQGGWLPGDRRYSLRSTLPAGVRSITLTALLLGGGLRLERLHAKFFLPTVRLLLIECCV